jgi:hypothetical protein
MKTRSDDKEMIDGEWLSSWAKKEPHVWSVRGTNLHVYYNRGGVLNGMWTILETLDDGDELDHCHVLNRGECRRMIDLISGAGGEADRPSDYPNWGCMSESQKDESIRMACF